jgi:hypothetical protein
MLLSGVVEGRCERSKIVLARYPTIKYALSGAILTKRKLLEST